MSSEKPWHVVLCSRRLASKRARVAGAREVEAQDWYPCYECEMAALDRAGYYGDELSDCWCDGRKGWSDATGPVACPFCGAPPRPRPPTSAPLTVPLATFLQSQ